MPKIKGKSLRKKILDNCAKKLKINQLQKKVYFTRFHELVSNVLMY